jgi:hypothetical protein
VVNKSLRKYCVSNLNVNGIEIVLLLEGTYVMLGSTGVCERIYMVNYNEKLGLISRHSSIFLEIFLTALFKLLLLPPPQRLHPH